MLNFYMGSGRDFVCLLFVWLVAFIYYVFYYLVNSSCYIFFNIKINV